MSSLKTLFTLANVSYNTHDQRFNFAERGSMGCLVYVLLKYNPDMSPQNLQKIFFSRVRCIDRLRGMTPKLRRYEEEKIFYKYNRYLKSFYRINYKDDTTDDEDDDEDHDEDGVYEEKYFSSDLYQHKKLSHKVFELLEKMYNLQDDNEFYNTQSLFTYVKSLFAAFSRMTIMCEHHHRYFSAYHTDAACWGQHISASGVIAAYTKPFYGNIIATNMAKRFIHQGADSITNYYGDVAKILKKKKNHDVAEVAEAIQQVWLDTARQGTELHKLLENYFVNEAHKNVDLHRDLISTVPVNVKDAIEKFLDEYILNNRWQIICTELPLSWPMGQLTGTADFIYLDESVDSQLMAYRNGEAMKQGQRFQLRVNIGDWKFLKDPLDTVTYKADNCLHELSDYIQTKEFKYTIQLNIYAQLLKHVWPVYQWPFDIIVDKLTLVAFNTTTNTFNAHVLQKFNDPLAEAVCRRGEMIATETHKPLPPPQQTNCICNKTPEEMFPHLYRKKTYFKPQ
ncbi:PD-(D/E)XK nuclease family protein [Cotesia congregata filamentous virus 1]|uniref:PD-(D/E)XK nuclease family protein n=1 Tax=Cotesia congregata filamentous virus 1 TaxID=3064291 RepID=A0ABC8QJW6_9VIRU|nr:PD-(D/E)XK nuclease family protein [Cotesia congregata filamentous virus 1]